ncbi:glutaredoxin-C9 [Lycium barbarum]|uniref:glutaredoxin-C9 n=1 Tax=Lycium barbarum TaxID=112863 RepID=UPI00293F1A05|nr:glutaredoxin-C9 [Lycium barbarum]
MQRTLPYRNWLSSTTTTTAMTGGSSSATSSGGSTTFESRSGESNETNSVGNTGSQNKNSVITMRVAKSVSENAIIVIATRGCCMCHVVKNLLLGLGVNPTIFEVNKEDEDDVITELSKIIGGDGGGGGRRTELPVVFVGGNLFGGLERVMSTHISGELVPILKQAGALWL